MKYAGLFRRFFAFTIDCLVLLGIYLFTGIILGASLFAYPISLLPMIGFWFFGGLFILSWLYFASLESSKRQATLGKQMLKLKVVNLKGKRIGFGRATARYFGKILSRMTFFIGLLMIAFTKKKQALHDKVAATLIIKR